MKSLVSSKGMEVGKSFNPVLQNTFNNLDWPLLKPILSLSQKKNSWRNIMVQKSWQVYLKSLLSTFSHWTDLNSNALYGALNGVEGFIKTYWSYEAVIRLVCAGSLVTSSTSWSPSPYCSRSIVSPQRQISGTENRRKEIKKMFTN